MGWKTMAAVLALAATTAGAQGTNCESLRAEIEARIRAAGVSRPQVTVVDAAAQAPGRVVGNCERGSRKIVYTQLAGGDAEPAPRPAAPARPAADPILTECKDGSMSVGGSCGKKP